jgi:hypothetical protein
MSHDSTGPTCQTGPTGPINRPPITLSYRHIARIVWRRVIHHPVIPKALTSMILVIIGLLYLAGTWVLTKWLISWGDMTEVVYDSGRLFVMWIFTSFIVVPIGVIVMAGLIVALGHIIYYVSWSCWNCCWQLRHDIEHDIYEKMARSI